MNSYRFPDYFIVGCLLFFALLFGIGDAWEYATSPVFNLDKQGIPGFMSGIMLAFAGIMAVIFFKVAPMPADTREAIRAVAIDQSFLNPNNVGNRADEGRIE